MGKSSKDKRDVYYRLAKEENFRSRSAFKLLQIDYEFDLFSGVSRVVDLCAAPGGWSQVVAQKLSPKENECQKDVKIVAVDLQPMAPLPGVVEIRGDITKKDTAQAVIEQLKGKYAELVLCDGAPDVTGLFDFDEYIQGQLLLAALNITTNILVPGGTFLAKLFRGKNVSVLVSHVKKYFTTVVITKPRTSRNSSIESFLLCKNYSAPPHFMPNMDKPLLLWTDLAEPSDCDVPFKACGKKTDYDSDTCYPLQLEKGKSYEYKEPKQAPISPPYATYLALQTEGKIQTTENTTNTQTHRPI